MHKNLPLCVILFLILDSLRLIGILVNEKDNNQK